MELPKVDFLYLSEPDMIQAGVKNMAGCIDAMEDVFSLMSKGDYMMGGPNGNEHGIKMMFPKTSNVEGMPLDGPDRRVVAMPAYLGGKYHLCGIKCYGSDQRNRGKGWPRSILMLTLMDLETGVPIAYMSANVLSAMRTGAVPGLGARHLSAKNPKVATIVGPGVMGRTAIDGFVTAQPTIDTVTYSDGLSEEVHGFNVPVSVIGEEFDLALIGKKGIWYDHKVSVQNPVPVESSTGAPADGSYTCQVTLSGGSGRASIDSPAAIVVNGKNITATIVWSSPHYEYMLVDGVQYDPIQTEGNSTFKIPVVLDKDMAVSASTVAMSQPHLVDYTLHFDSATLKEE